MKEGKILIPVATEEQIKAWKEKWQLFKVEVEYEGHEYSFIAKKIDRDTRCKVETYADKQMKKAREIILNTLLTGKAEVREHDDLFFLVTDELFELIPSYPKATVTKL
ncbi:hypothetical protein [Flammeovirga sp. OC4]|uniref:hypothetical protein n=1 Tax=Flammeovirga sp. OC4 TaxID=1382345 RepID=UPI0005C76AB3|nr:hypothetical protein [Flammeovirga sp. OC4]